jgi:hypothetical protein
LVSGVDELSNSSTETEWEKTETEVPFFHLSIDLPPCPLFRDSHGGLIIPQIPLFEVLRKKFDGYFIIKIRLLFFNF